MTQTAVTSRVERFLDWTVVNYRQTAFILFGLSVALFLTALGSGLIQDDDSRLGFEINWPVWPEALAALLFGGVTLGTGIWLAFSETEKRTRPNLRILWLVVGGGWGLIVSLATLGRVGRWWSDVFSGGLDAWQGPHGYRLWLCIGAELAGLIIMFASLHMVRGQERAHVVMRRLIFGYNSVLNSLLLLAILAIVNILFYTVFPTSYHWTKTRGLAKIGSRSRNILSNLKKDVYVYVLMAQAGPIYQDVNRLLENCQEITTHIKVETLSPDLVPASYIDQMVKLFPNARLERGILISYGKPVLQNTARNISLIPQRDLFSGEQGIRGGRDEAGETLVFKGEDVLLSEIAFLEEGKQSPRVYFTQDNEEFPLTSNARDPFSLARFKDQLQKDKYEVWSLHLREKPPGITVPSRTVFASTVPKDAAAVVIVQPRSAFSSAALDSLRKYLDKKGKLLVFLGLEAQVNQEGLSYFFPRTGLGKLLTDFNVQIGDSYVLRYPRDQADQRKVLYAPAAPPSASNNRIAKAMVDRVLQVPVARPVRRLSRTQKFLAEPVLEVSAKLNAWEEKNLFSLRNPLAYINFLAQEERLEKLYAKESIPIAQAVTDAKDDRPVMVVCGIRELPTMMASSPLAYDFVLNSLHWLLGRAERLGIAPIKSHRFSLPANVNESRMKLLPAWLVLAVIIGLGAGIWVTRRR